MTSINRSIRLDSELWEALDVLADADQRTTASLIRKVLVDHATKVGALPPKAEPTTL